MELLKCKHLLKFKFEFEETLDIKNYLPLSIVISFRTNKNGNEL